MGYQRLSAQDAAFLHLETPTSPMHVGSVTLFEAGPFLDESGRFRLDDVRRLIEGRLRLVPRYRQRLLEVAFEAGRPVWVDDERFDIAYHVRLTALPRPGTEEQLRALAGRLHAAALDRRRPLWEFWFVDGVQGDRIALIHKTHHAMVDGIASVDVATVLFDLEPSPAPRPDDVEHWEPRPAPSAAVLLAETVAEEVRKQADLLRRFVQSGREPAGVLTEVVDAGRALRSTVRQTDAPRMPFNAPIGPHRRYEMARVSLDATKAVKTAFGCTVNDVVLAMVAGGLRHYLEESDVPTEGLVLKALVPVSVRNRPSGIELGNKVAAMVADLPVGERDEPAAGLRSIHEQLRDLKAATHALDVERIGALLDFAPPTLLSLAARLAPLQRTVNLIVTNVPGPPVSLYCMGAKLLEPFPYIGLADNLGLAVAVVSYDGQLCFGLTGDRDLVPDLAVLAEGIEKAAAELQEAMQQRAGRETTVRP